MGFCQPSVVPSPPNGPGWFHEIKHDGFRLAVRRDAGGIRLLTRNGHDWSDRYPSILSAANALRCKSFVIDGEVVVAGDDGLADFNLLRYGQRVKPEAFLYAFDLLELNGHDLRRKPIEERKAALAKLLARKGTPGIELVDHLDFDDAAMFFEARLQSSDVRASLRSARDRPTGPADRRIGSRPRTRRRRSAAPGGGRLEPVIVRFPMNVGENLFYSETLFNGFRRR